MEWYAWAVCGGSGNKVITARNLKWTEAVAMRHGISELPTSRNPWRCCNCLPPWDISSTIHLWVKPLDCQHLWQDHVHRTTSHVSQVVGGEHNMLLLAAGRESLNWGLGFAFTCAPTADPVLDELFGVPLSWEGGSLAAPLRGRSLSSKWDPFRKQLASDHPAPTPSHSLSCRVAMLVWFCAQLLFQCDTSLPSKNDLEA